MNDELFNISVLFVIYAIQAVLSARVTAVRLHRRLYSRSNVTVFVPVLHRLSGFVLFGCVGLLAGWQCGISLDFLLLHNQTLSLTLLCAGLGGLFYLGVAYLNVRNSKSSIYPQFKLPVWTMKYQMLTYSTWVLYLWGYEVLFRGLFLWALLDVFDLLTAVVINTLSYAVVHVSHGWKEVLGCLLLGPLLCYITIETSNIYAALAIHLSLCLGNEYLSIAREQRKQKVGLVVG